MKKEQAFLRFRQEVLSKADEIDPKGYKDWTDIALGFLLGCGFKLEDCEDWGELAEMCSWESHKDDHEDGEPADGEQIDENQRVMDVRLPAVVSKKLRNDKKSELGNQYIFDCQKGNVTLKNGKTIKNVAVLHLSYVVLNKKYKTTDIVDVKIKKPWMMM
jgi:hypothetical protein